VKVVILAGGYGTRLAEETAVRPKPMVEIGGMPILWHIMEHYAHYGFKEFCVALGYKGLVIKRYFQDYCLLNGSITVDLAARHIESRDSRARDWNIHLVDTGLGTPTGSRLKRLEPVLGSETFMLTYGDGVSNVDLRELLAFHRSHGRIGTVTAVRPPARFGGITIDCEIVKEFEEKPQIGEGWINGGFFVFEPAVFRYLDPDQTVLESDALEQLAREGQLAAFRHDDFWQCMDTLRDLRRLEQLWEGGKPPWKSWGDDDR
jgi:glucose-1-phosphate cytidylyltransferase